MEYEDVQKILKDENLRQFVQDSFRDSMKGIGFSKELIDEFVGNIHELPIADFIKTHQEELQQIELHHYGDTLIPKFLTEYVMPYIPREGTFLDLGCGRGTLISLVQAQNSKQQVVGVDIVSAPEWESLKKEQTKFIVASDTKFISVLNDEQPTCVTATMVMHHLEYQEQARYLKAIHDALPKGATVILLEDSYSMKLDPELGLKRHGMFMRLSQSERLSVMGLYDWYANRVFCMRTNTPVPFAYRTIEAWEEIGSQAGFTHVTSRFIGYPKHFDVHTPRALLVFKKL